MTEPLVILPGFMSDARGFLPQIIDLGIDRTVTIAMPLGGDTLEQMAESILDTLPARFALLGHGLGGGLAVELLRHIPERITRLVLMATDPLSEGPNIAADREARLVAAKAGRLAEALSQEVPKHALAPLPWRDAVIELLQDMGLGLGIEAYVAQSRAMQRRGDQQKILRRVMQPSLILAGRSDVIVPLRRQEFLSQLMPTGELQVIEDAGHHPQLEQAEAVSRALRLFLDR